jgi:hypothetical protein
MNDLRITGLSVDVVRWPLKMKRRHGVGDIDCLDRQSGLRRGPHQDHNQ